MAIDERFESFSPIDYAVIRQRKTGGKKILDFGFLDSATNDAGETTTGDVYRIGRSDRVP